MRESNAHFFPGAMIAGKGAVTAVGRGVEALRTAVRTNSSGLGANERFSEPRFQSNVVGAAPGVEAADNPAFCLANEALDEARNQAREILATVSTERIALILATTKANIRAMELLSEGRTCSESARRHLQPDALAADLARAHGAKGPVQCVSLACVSGLIALQQGARLIQRRAADAVYVVGVDSLSAFIMAGFTALKALDPNGCRPFDKNRGGLSPGEAGAAVVLVRADNAPASVITLRGWGGSNDANHMTGPSRDGSGLAAAIRVALQAADLEPGDIDYINAHGTGTPYNDAMESQALNAVFGASCPPVSASKGMVGHTLGAAGVLETILCALAMQDGWLPGTPRLQNTLENAPNALVDTPRVATRLNHALKINTGFGGANAALILSNG